MRSGATSSTGVAAPEGEDDEDDVDVCKAYMTVSIDIEGSLRDKKRSNRGEALHLKHRK